MKKILTALLLVFGLATAVQASDMQTKPPCTILSQFGNTKYFLVRGMYDKNTYSKRDITALQNFLAYRYGLKQSDFVTGYFGKTTEVYVKKYQKENGLTQSGMVGQGTRAKMRLDSDCSVSTPLTVDATTTYQTLTTSSNVTFSYPKTWIAEEEKQFFAKVYTKISEDKSDEYSATIEVTTDKSIATSTKTLEDLVKERNNFSKPLFDMDKKYRLLKSEHTMINGNEVWVLEENLGSGEGTTNELLRLRTIYFTKNGKVVILEMAARDSKWNNYVNIFDTLPSKVIIN